MIFYVPLTFWVFIVAATRQKSIINNSYNAVAIMCGLVSLLVFQLSTGDHLHGDLSIYVDDFYNMSYLSLTDIFQQYSREPLYLFTQWALSRLSNTSTFYIASSVGVFMILFIAGLRKLFTPSQLLLVVFTYLNIPFLYGYLINGVRQGIAIALMILAIGLMIKHKKFTVWTAVTLVCAWGFHSSALLVALALVVIHFAKLSSRTLILGWVSASVLYFTGLNANLMGWSKSYFTEVSTYASLESIEFFEGGVNRFDFWAFSSIWIILYLVVKRYLPNRTEMFERVFSIYVILNILFLLFGFIAFSNRIAIYSWILIPLLVWMPIFNVEGSKKQVLSVVIITISVLIGIATKAVFYLI